jgi:hypothetical protein
MIWGQLEEEQEEDKSQRTDDGAVRVLERRGRLRECLYAAS